MSQRRALLLGSTGLIGKRAREHLAAGGRYTEVVCLVRKATGAPGEKVVDFATLDRVDPVDDVFCAIGTTMKKAGSREAFRAVDHDLPLKVAKLAVAAGAQRMVLVSSVGASAKAGSFYLRTKGELEDALAALGLRALHVLRPSLLLGDRAESRPGESVGIAVARATGFLLMGGLRKYRAIDADVVARAMVAAAAGADDGVKVYEHDAIVKLAG
jgi:uncharacterized protein YbjT (DUF2867 family)